MRIAPPISPETAPRRHRGQCLPGSILASLAVGWLCTLSPARAAPSFRVYLESPGVYRLTHDELAEAGLEGSLESGCLALSSQGRPVPIWTEDGGDGSFDPGDRLEWVGERLHGESTYFHPHARHNVYRLTCDRSGGGRRMLSRRAVPFPDGRRHLLRGRRHLEADELLIRLSQQVLDRSRDPELWYWAKLTYVDPKPFVVDLELEDLARPGEGSGEEIRLGIHFRAISETPSRRRAPGTADHRVEARLNGELLAVVEWNGRQVHRLEIDDLDPRLLRAGSNRLELRVPERVPEGAERPLIDVVMLDWIELDYPRAPRLEGGRLWLADPGSPGKVVLDGGTGEEGGDLIAYSDAGTRIEPEIGVGGGLRFPTQEGEESFLLASPSRLMRPVRVEVDRPSTWRREDRRADYLMITHASLRQAIEPLAELHRRRGLEVEVVEVQDIYDEFSHGIAHPRAIRDFVAHAYHRWQPPRPRFVLLVGDASWDIREARVDDADYANWTDRQLLEGERFVARETIPYRESTTSRNLIPTWSFQSSHGHSASDNYFVAVDGEDFHPDLAIGRLPVATAGEVADIVEKTAAYLDRPPAGPWRRSMLWITNEKPGFQQHSDKLAARLEERGFASLKVYPEKSEKDNEHHQQTLLDAFDAGQAVVHFYGHGGRNIWRTGPPSLRKNHDLFTLEHIDRLEPNERLPMVLSMTCFSAPFDHPSADSIGEKMLRAPRRGAIAVLAASWRSPASQRLSWEVLPRLIVPGTAIGTAVMEAKREIRSRPWVELYNLLGDPALPLPTARGELGAAPSPGAAGE